MIAWAALLAADVPAAIGVVLLLLTRDAAVPDAYGLRGFSAVGAIVYSSVGALILARRPGNRVGWILAAAGVVGGVQVFLTEYVTYGALVHPGALPGAVWAAWLGSWVWVLFVLLTGPAFALLFPEGSLLSPRWKWNLWLAIGSVSLVGFALAFQPGPLDSFSFVTNPLGVDAIRALDPIRPVVQFGFLAALLLAASSLVVRYRRAGSIERQQLKWVVFAALVVGILSPLGVLGGKVGEILLSVGLLGIPVAAGIAVLRYRLYEIDVLINQTIVYGLLTAILAGAYAALVALMQRFFIAATGQESDAAIVLTTLAVVSAFTPVKSRLQGLVDRRFRETADPSRALAELAAALASRLGRVDPHLALSRLLGVAVAGFDATGGDVRLDSGADSHVAATFGTRLAESSDEVPVVIFHRTGAGSIRLRLGHRIGGAPYGAAGRASLTAAVAAVGDALEADGWAVPGAASASLSADPGTAVSSRPGRIMVAASMGEGVEIDLSGS